MKDVFVNLLEEVIRARKPALSFLIPTARQKRLTPEQREALRSIVADEMIENVTSKGELSPKGVLLDDLISALGEATVGDDSELDEAEVDRLLDL